MKTSDHFCILTMKNNSQTLLLWGMVIFVLILEHHLCVDFGAFIYINVTEMRYHVLSDCII